MPLVLLFSALAVALHLGPHGTRLLAADARCTARPGTGRHRRRKHGQHAAPHARPRGARR